jgi:hypothetical protein
MHQVDMSSVNTNWTTSTTTDICALLKSGYPRQAAAFVKIAGVRTNFTIPDVHSIALGGGSIIRTKHERTLVGPDSVGSRLDKESIAFGGETLTVSFIPPFGTRRAVSRGPHLRFRPISRLLVLPHCGTLSIALILVNTLRGLGGSLLRSPTKTFVHSQFTH